MVFPFVEERLQPNWSKLDSWGRSQTVGCNKRLWYWKLVSGFFCERQNHFFFTCNFTYGKQYLCCVMTLKYGVHAQFMCICVKHLNFQVWRPYFCLMCRKDVARQVRTKTEQQCERHYTWSYLERPKPPLPILDETEVKLHPSPVVFKCKFKDHRM